MNLDGMRGFLAEIPCNGLFFRLPDSQVHKLVQSKPPLEMKLEVDENGTVPREPVVKEEPSEVKAVLKSCDNFDLQIKAE